MAAAVKVRAETKGEIMRVPVGHNCFFPIGNAEGVTVTATRPELVTITLGTTLGTLVVPTTAGTTDIVITSGGQEIHRSTLEIVAE